MYDSVQAHQLLNQAVNEIESLKTRLLNGINEHPDLVKVKEAFESLEDVIGGTVGLVRDEASNSLVNPGHEAAKEEAQEANEPKPAETKAVEIKVADAKPVDTPKQ